MAAGQCKQPTVGAKRSRPAHKEVIRFIDVPIGERPPVESVAVVPPESQEYEPEEPLEIQHDEYPQDFWTLNENVLIRHHRTPRTTLFNPEDVEAPIPTKYLDVMRRTETNLETMAEKVIRDFWTDDTQDERTELADKWIGKTIFDLQHPTPKDGYEWVEHRLTKIEENTGRPGTMWPEEYWRLSKNKKRQACIEADQVLEARRQARIRGGHRTTNIPCLLYTSPSPRD